MEPINPPIIDVYMPEDTDPADDVAQTVEWYEAVVDSRDEAIEEYEASNQPPDPLAFIAQYEITMEQAEQIADPTWLYKDLIIQGHMVMVVAEPNGGKTTIMWHVATVIAKSVKMVAYVNADISGADAKAYVKKAIDANIRLLLPDMHVGTSMGSVIDDLRDLNASGHDLTGIVFFFDTLKKMTDVLSKQAAASLLKLLRSLTTKGATIVCLAHTNKHKDAQGNYVLEGTGDIGADTDEMIFLIPQKMPDGSMLVSTQPNKVRGSFDRLTFNISADRQVEQQGEFVDVARMKWEEDQQEKDRECIDAVLDELRLGDRIQTQIYTAVNELIGVGKSRLVKVLRRYENVFWVSQKQMSKNSRIYRIKTDCNTEKYKN